MCRRDHSFSFSSKFLVFFSFPSFLRPFNHSALSLTPSYIILLRSKSFLVHHHPYFSLSLPFLLCPVKQVKILKTNLLFLFSLSFLPLIIIFSSSSLPSLYHFFALILSFHLIPSFLSLSLSVSFIHSLAHFFDCQIQLRVTCIQ